MELNYNHKLFDIASVFIRNIVCILLKDIQ